MKNSFIFFFFSFRLTKISIGHYVINKFQVINKIYYPIHINITDII